MSLQADITKADGWFIGEDKVLSYTIVDQNVAAHTPVDITGFTIDFLLSATYSGADIFTVPAVLDADPTTGVCTVTVASSYTINLAADDSYWYSLRRTDPGAFEELAFGNVFLRDVWVDYA